MPDDFVMYYRGVWGPTVAYVPGDMVHYEVGGSNYFCVCIVANTNVDPIADAGGTGAVGPHWQVEF